MKLENRYVLHIPLCRFADGKLISIDIDEVLVELTGQLDSFYITMAQSHYKSRDFEEILITVFTCDGKIEETFKEWFIKTNNILGQEAFAYEKGCELIIEEVK